MAQYAVRVPEETVVDWLIDHDEALMSFKTPQLASISIQFGAVEFILKVEEIEETYEDDEDV